MPHWVAAVDNSNHFPGASRKQTMLGELRIFSLKGLESGVDNHQFSSSSQWLRMAPRGPGAFILPSSPPLAHTPTPGQLFLHASQAHAYYLSESCESGMQRRCLSWCGKFPVQGAAGITAWSSSPLQWPKSEEHWGVCDIENNRGTRLPALNLRRFLPLGGNWNNRVVNKIRRMGWRLAWSQRSI